MSKRNFSILRFTQAGLLLLAILFHLTATAQYVTNGTAIALEGDAFQLTKATITQAGSVWFQNKINLNSDFEIRANLNLGNRSGSGAGADGIAFVLQPICSGLGSRGGGLGYQSISPSLAVEFDTWQNGHNNDPVADHIALQKNGDTNHGSANKLAGPVSLPELEDGKAHAVVITWTKATNTLKVMLDGTVRINYSGAIIQEVFQGDPQVFWGFTAATGAAFNVQTVDITGKTFQEEKPYIVQPACPNANDGAIKLTAMGNQGPYTYLWSNGSSQEDLTQIPAGTYTVTISDRNSCKSQYSIEVPTRNILPILEQALNQDVDGDGSADPLVLGAGSSTLTFPPGTGNCLEKWLYGAAGTTPSGLKSGKGEVGSDCRPGTNPVDADGRLTNPLLAEALKLNVLVRRSPALGTKKLSSMSCTIPPIVMQALAPDPDVNELLRVTNAALGNVALQPHLRDLLAALKCINGPFIVCE